MHDDDLSGDELRAALARRTLRSEPAGVDDLIARLDIGQRVEGRGRGMWMAAAAVIVVLGGLVGYVASVDGPQPDDGVAAADGGGPDAPQLDGTGEGLQSERTATGGDLTDDLAEARSDLEPGEVVAEYAETLADTDLLVVNGTWGLGAHEIFRELFSARLDDPESPWASGHIADSDTLEWPGSVLFVSPRDPDLWPVGLALARSLGIADGSVVESDVDARQWGIEIGFRPEIVLVIGEDLDASGVGTDADPMGAGCVVGVTSGLCIGDALWREDSADAGVLHPPNEVRVLLLNGSTESGLAGRTGDDLRANRGYDALAPGNAVEPSTASMIHYVPGYELDARQVAQILNVMPESVQPLLAGVVPQEIDGEPHVVVVLGGDFAD